MPSSKKYTLYSANSAAPGEKPLCAFFTSEGGCRNGDNCRFSHATGWGETKRPSRQEKQKDDSVEVSESSSVLSSESEESVKHTPKRGIKMVSLEVPCAGSSSSQEYIEKQQKVQAKEEKQKKQKRKSTDGDMFAGPKNNVPIVKAQAPETPRKKAKKARDVKHVAQCESTTNLKRFISNLPVASFSFSNAQRTPVSTQNNHENLLSSTNADSNSAWTDTHASEKEESNRKPIVIQITSSEVARKWQKVVNKTRQHERYSTAYDFSRYQKIDEQNGIKAEWIKAKPYGPWCKSNPQAIAIDCEMCETQDPLSGTKNYRALCRLSVVNADNPEEVLLDTLVKPSWPVTDYRTFINGVTKEHLDGVEFTLRHAQAFMMALCSEETVIVGHAVHNDLAALNMHHEVIADTSFLFRAKDSSHAIVSLKDTVRAVLKTDMPDTHDSVNDARKTLECILHWIRKDGDVTLVERTSNYKGNQLFVHRIPKQCQAEDLASMFLKHTTIHPMEVDGIVFNGNTGKTHVTFKSAAHADLAFDSIDGNAETDLSGRMQKKVYLRNGDYVRVRKMVHNVKRANPSESPNQNTEQPTHQTNGAPTVDTAKRIDVSKKQDDSLNNRGSYAPFRFADMINTRPSWWKQE